MQRLLFLSPLLIAVVVGGFFLWGLNPERNPNEIPSVLISQPAPEFQLPGISGLSTPGLGRRDLLTEESPIVLNVFASWCVPCRAEHAVLTDLVAQDGVTLLGINYKDKPEDAVKWLEELGNPYSRIGADINGRAGIEWGISGVPETFIVGRDGIVLFRYVGPVVGTDAVAKFKSALSEAKSHFKQVGG